MKIEIRNVKYAKFMSEETECFEATVLIDGKVEGKVSNEGHGGCNFYHPHTLGDKLETYAKTLPPCKSQYGDLEMDADLLIGDLFEKWSLEKDLKKTLKTRVLFLRDGKLLQTKKYDSETLSRLLSNVEVVAKLNAEKVLNTISFDEALSIYAKIG